MKKILFSSLIIFCSIWAHGQYFDCQSRLQPTWIYKGIEMHPVVVKDSVVTNGKQVYRYCIMTAKKSAKLFANTYIGIVKDSTRKDGFRIDPDEIRPYYYTDSCSAKAAFWKMMEHHPRHQ